MAYTKTATLRKPAGASNAKKMARVARPLTEEKKMMRTATPNGAATSGVKKLTKTAIPKGASTRTMKKVKRVSGGLPDGTGRSYGKKPTGNKSKYKIY